MAAPQKQKRDSSKKATRSPSVNASLTPPISSDAVKRRKRLRELDSASSFPSKFSERASRKTSTKEVAHPTRLAKRKHASNPACTANLGRVRALDVPPPQPTTPVERAAVRYALEKLPLDTDMTQTRRLNLSQQNIQSLPAVLAITFSRICTLDISKNALKPKDLGLIPYMANLSNLNISHNTVPLVSLEFLQLSNQPAERTPPPIPLVVLSVGNCGLRTLKGVESCAVTLKTLIANDNELRLCSPSAVPSAANDIEATIIKHGVGSYQAIIALQELEAAVLSRNASLCALWKLLPPEPEEEKPSVAKENSEDQWKAQAHSANRHPLSAFHQLPRLKKLSLSGCHIDSLPSRFFLPVVTELRLSHNHLTSLYPESFIARSLHLLDVTHNDLTEVSTLRRFHYLQQVNLRGNPVFDSFVKTDKEQGYLEADAQRLPLSLKRRLCRLLPELKRIDGIDVAAPDPVKNTEGKTMANEDEMATATSTEPSLANESEVHSLKVDESAERNNSPGEQSSDESPSPSDQVKIPSASGDVKQEDLPDVVIDLEANESPNTSSVVRRERVYSLPGLNSEVKGAQGKKGKAKSGKGATVPIALSGSAAVASVLAHKQLSSQEGW